ncbi:MAG TPA: DUF2971 domain-containing protein [Prosthecobacter sp.]|nr:DUF2971 domain-containing protein [Prosthecobacter sp.]
MAYFKYVTEERIDVLRTLKIRYTQISALNDPFEALPAIEQPLSEKEYEVHARKEIRRHTRNLPGATPLRLKEFRKKLLADAMNDFSHEQGAIAAKRYQSRIRSITDFTLGFLCLSKTPSNILMWSHYADCHRGMVLEFDSHHDYFRHGTEDVVYSDRRPSMTLHDEHPTTEILRTKSLDWAYEEEVRRNESLSPKKKPTSGGGHIILAPSDASEDPKKIHLFDIPKDLITGVILGWKTSVSFRSQVRDAAKELGIRSTKIRQAIPSRREYKMDIVEFNNTSD